jgi:hypothetical protein
MLNNYFYWTVYAKNKMSLLLVLLLLPKIYKEYLPIYVIVCFFQYDILRNYVIILNCLRSEHFIPDDDISMLFFLLMFSRATLIAIQSWTLLVHVSVQGKSENFITSS